MTMVNDFFKNLKVVELASVLAGPAVGMFFAEMGAQVTKIENATTHGDVTRAWKLPSEPADSTYTAYFCSVNWHKTYQWLDLTQPDQLQIVYDMLREADIVISNFKKSSAKKLGLAYEQVTALKPDIIYGQITGYGEEDEIPAFDVVLQADSGFMYMNGEADGAPVKMPVALIDMLAAHQLKEGLLVALLQRQLSGKGSYVSVSLVESAIASLANQATNWLMAGHIPQRMGSQHPNIAPYGDILYTNDKKGMVLAVGTERQFTNLCDVLKIDLTTLPQFATNAQRVKHRTELLATLQAHASHWESETLLQTLRRQQVPCAFINDMKAVFEQPVAQRLLLTETMPDGTASKRVKTVVFELR